MQLAPSWLRGRIAGRGGLAATVAVLILALLVPPLTNAYVMRVAIVILMFAVAAQAWNIVGGYAGYPSFGHVVFFGVCAYATAFAMANLGWPFVAALPAGTLVAMALAAFISPVLRLQGHYFVVVTFGIAEAVREIILNMDVTGGGRGFMVPIVAGSVSDVNTAFYYGTLLLLVIVVLTTWLMLRSRLGHSLVAIRENEQAAEQLGIDTVRAKITAFFLSAFFAAVPGGLYAYWMSFIDPADVFAVGRSLTAVVAALLGGTGTLLGPTIGTLILLGIAELTWSGLQQFNDAVLGAIIIIVVLFLPRGIMAQVAEGWAGLRPARFLATMKRYRLQ